MALYLIVVQAHFIMNNIFEGMIWFFLPVSLVITNDIFAYVCGITFGRTQLIKISPKKTVEGMFTSDCRVIVTSANVYRLCRRLGLHGSVRLRHDQCPHALQVLYLPG